MILVITTTETNERTGKPEVIVSHGIDSITDKLIVLPNETPDRIGAIFDSDLGEYVVRDKSDPSDKRDRIGGSFCPS